MRFLVDLSSDDDGRVSGHVAVDGGHPTPFSGWLELLRVLEHGTGGDGTTGGSPRLGDGLDGQETAWDG